MDRDDYLRHLRDETDALLAAPARPADDELVGWVRAQADRLLEVLSELDPGRTTVELDRCTPDGSVHPAADGPRDRRPPRGRRAGRRRVVTR